MNVAPPLCVPIEPPVGLFAAGFRAVFPPPERPPSAPPAGSVPPLVASAGVFSSPGGRPILGAGMADTPRPTVRRDVLFSPPPRSPSPGFSVDFCFPLFAPAARLWYRRTSLPRRRRRRSLFGGGRRTRVPHRAARRNALQYLVVPRLARSVFPSHVVPSSSLMHRSASSSRRYVTYAPPVNWCASPGFGGLVCTFAMGPNREKRSQPERSISSRQYGGVRPTTYARSRWITRAS